MLLSSLLILGAAIFLWRQFERLPVVQHDYPTNRPQEAAMQLLGNWHKETRRITSATELFPLPDNSALLIIERHRGHMPQWQQQALIEWVENGGRLVINALPLQEDASSQSQSDSPGAEDIRKHDPLLYHFGVTSWLDRNTTERQELPLPSATGVAVLEYNFRRFCLDRTSYQDECVTTTCGAERPELQYAWLELAEDNLQLDPEPAIDLLHRDLFEQTDDNDPSIPVSEATVISRANNGTNDLILQLTAGSGEIWVFTSLDIFSNDRLHHLDHAFLLKQLSEDRERVWWIQSIDVPSLEHWLWQRGWPLISALMLLLLVFLWHKMPRRGVMLQSGDLQHQDFTAHLRASSALLWRIRQHREILQPLRHNVQRALLKHAGGDNPESRITLAAELSGLSPEQIERAFDEIPANETAMIELVAILQRLRQRI